MGCSGWQYKHWRGNLYPIDLPASRWLEHYAAHFDTVELNNSFYRLPSAENFSAWRQRVPAGFVYAVKASRYLTHLKKLKEPAEPLQLFFSRARALRERLGPVLYQLPPRWRLDLDRLATFLRALPKSRQHAIEFRDASWYVDDTYNLLQRHRVALCIHDMAGAATGQILVGPFVYLRLHGPQRYAGRYSDAALARWAEWIAEATRNRTPAYIYFNNDIGGHAPRDAIRLRELCARAGASVSM